MDRGAQDHLSSDGLPLRGTEVGDVGSWHGHASHPIGARLSPLHIPVTGYPQTTPEQFWQSKKCLAVWEDE